MYLRNRWTEYPGGAPIVGEDVLLKRSSDGALQYTETTDSDGWATFAKTGSPGICYQELTYGGETRRIFGSTSGQRNGLYDGEFGTLIDVFQNGVISSNYLEVVPVSGMNVKIKPGFANGGDNIFSSYADHPITIAANSSGSVRYDYIYVEISSALSAEEPYASKFKVAAGETERISAGFVASVDNRYLIHLATITVANGASSITAGNIADERVYTQPINSIGAMFDLSDVNETEAEMAQNDILAWDNATNKFRRYSTSHLHMDPKVESIAANVTKLGPSVGTPRTVKVMEWVPDTGTFAFYDITFHISITLRASPNSGVIDLKLTGEDGFVWSRRCTTNGNVSLPYELHGAQKNVAMNSGSPPYTMTLTATWISGDGSFIDEGQIWMEAHPRMVGAFG